MFSNRVKGYLQNVMGCLLFSGFVAVSVAGCQEAAKTEKATSDRALAQRYAAAQVRPLPLGQPFLINGCMVQLYRIAVETPVLGVSTTQEVTMSTADCPTAQVTATNEKCGKSCVTDTLQVEPKALGGIEAPVPAPP